MNFSDKTSQLVARTLIADRQLALNELESVGVKGGSYLKSVLFEGNITLSTGSLPPSQALFGTGSYMNDGGYFRGTIVVGRYTSIGRRVSIGAANHWTSGLSSSPLLSGGPPERAYSPDQLAEIGTIRHSKPDMVTRIGHDVWIGDGAVVLPGVSIGTGAVIGANAVVSRDIAPYAVVAGVPARPLRKRFPDEIIAELLHSEWWDIPYEQLRTLPLGNILDA